MFQAIWEILWFCLETIPSVLKLAMPAIVNVLPIIIDDEIGYVDFVFGQCFDGFEDLFLV